MIGQTSKAYVDAMKSEHRGLADVTHQLQLVLKEATARRWPRSVVEDLCGRLGQLEGTLAEHFGREERGGFLEEALTHAPRFGALAERLMAEHVEMLACIRDLVEQAERNRQLPVASWDRFADALAAVLKQLLAHEAQENALLQTAFNVDNDILQ